MSTVTCAKGRIAFLDFISGVLLLKIMLGHSLQASGLDNSLFYKFIGLLYFAMPWFFFKAGMFHKKQSIYVEIRKSFRRLLIPYIIFCVIGILVFVVSQICAGHALNVILFKKLLAQIITHGSCRYNEALWFLLSLFICKIIFSALVHVYEKHPLYYRLGGGKFYSIIFFSTIGMVAVLCGALGLYIGIFPFYLTIPTGLVFYLFGFIYKKRMDILHRININYWLLAIFLSYIIFFVYRPVVGMYDMTETSIGKYLFWVPYSIITILCVNVLSYEVLLRRKSIGIIQLIGKESMVFYVTHMPIIGFSLFLGNLFNYYDGILGFLIIIVFQLILLPLFYFISNIRVIKILFGKS